MLVGVAVAALLVRGAGAYCSLRARPREPSVCMATGVGARTAALIRDSGGTRALLDGATCLSALGMALSRPSLLGEFLRCRERFRRVKYGAGAKDVVHLQDLDAAGGASLVFVHGGAWGSGQPWMYFLCARNLALALDCRSVAVVEHALYPQHSLLQQADSVARALRFLRGQHPLDEVLLAGHSSGANLCALAALADPTLAQTLLLFNGVFDLRQHYGWEASRGVHLVSPMGGAAPDFDACSPSLLLAAAARLPPVLLVHNAQDATVPLRESQQFARALRQRGMRALTHFPQGDHVDSVMQATLADSDFRHSELMRAVSRMYAARGAEQA